MASRITQAFGDNNKQVAGWLGGSCGYAPLAPSRAWMGRHHHTCPPLPLLGLEHQPGQWPQGFLPCHAWGKGRPFEPGVSQVGGMAMITGAHPRLLLRPPKSLRHFLVLERCVQIALQTEFALAPVVQVTVSHSSANSYGSNKGQVCTRS